jgi:hypothetical protein
VLARKTLTRMTTLFLIRLSVVENILVDLFDEQLEIERQRAAERQHATERKRDAARQHEAKRQQDAFSMKKIRLQETIDGRELGRP